MLLMPQAPDSASDLPTLGEDPHDDGLPADDAAAAKPPARSPAEREALARGLMADDELTALLEGAIVKRGVRNPADVEEVLQTTYLAASAADLPSDPEARRRYIAGIAVNQAFNIVRDAWRAPELPGDDALEVVASAVPASAEAWAELRNLDEKLRKRDPIAWDALLGVADGERFDQLAAKANLNPDQLRKRVRRIQERIVTGVVALLALLGYRWKHVPAMAHDDAPDLSPTEPALDTRLERSAPTDVATLLRGRAFRACLYRSWVRCLDDLDLAREVDPAGDDDPRVRAARADATEGLQHLEDKLPTWQPRNVAVYESAARR